MPKRLIDRLAPDSIGEFVSSAIERFDDGSRLADNDRGTAAIYLWGYAAEMLVKAAFFRVIGFTERQPILVTDLRLAVHVTAVQTHKLVWPHPGRFHNVEMWAQLLGAERRIRGLPYSNSTYERRVAAHCRTTYRLWRETLRYHRNRSYAFEVNTVRTSTAWLLANTNQL